MLTVRFFRRPLASSGKLAVLSLAAGACLALAGSASAQVFKVTATGSLTFVGDYAGVFDSTVTVGTPYTFSFLFDYSTPGVPFEPDIHYTDTAQSYSVTGANFGGTATFGDCTFRPSSNTLSRVEVGNNLYNSINQNIDAFDFTSSLETTTGVSGPTLEAQTRLYLDDINGLLLSSEALPPLSVYNSIDLSSLSDPYFSILVQNSNGASGISGSIDSLSAELVNPVPEASSVVSFSLLLTLGLGGVMIAAKRKRTNAKDASTTV